MSLTSVIGQNNTPPSFIIDDYKFDVQNGVTKISIQHRDHYGWDIEYTDIDDSEVENYYYYIDGIYDEAFSHWTYESGIYLHVFNKLKEKYPAIKVLSFRNKGFKTIQYEAYGISPVNTIESIKNKVIFIKNCSQADHTECKLYLTHVRRWYNYLMSLRPVVEKDIDILYLPRSSTENYREISEIKYIQNSLINIFNEYNGAIIYYTDKTRNIADQIELIGRAKILVVNEGGNVLVNGYFAKNSHIIVIGGNGPNNGYHFQNPRPALIYYDSIKNGNSYYHLAYSSPASYVLELIDKIKENIIKPFLTPAVKCWRENWKGCIHCNEINWRYPESLLEC
jgi:hypothetical protein